MHGVMRNASKFSIELKKADAFDRRGRTKDCDIAIGLRTLSEEMD